MTARRTLRWAAIVLTAIVVLPTALPAHGDDDHGAAKTAAGATVAGMQGDVLTTSGQSDYFEVVVKYPSTDAGDDTQMRMFVADYATNTPIIDAGLSLSFKPSGVVVRGHPKMVAPGTYDLVVRFPADGVYTLVATITAGKRSDFIEVANIYSGEAAATFLAEHSTNAPVAVAQESTSWLTPIAIAAGILVAALVAFIVIRRRRAAPATSATTVARDPELAVQPRESESDSVK